MSEYGVPSLEGVWRGPSGTPLDYGRQQPAGQELEAAVNARRLTATGFSGDTGRRNLRALRRDNGIALTPWARVELQRLDGTRFGRSEADGPEDRNTWERCLTRGLPPAALPEPQADHWQIFQTRETVAILSEALHEVRTIRIGAEDAEAPPQWLGTSTGRWTDGRFIATTTGIRTGTGGVPAEPIPGQHPGTGEGLRITESWRPIDANRMVYRMRVDDPKTYTRPIRYAFTLRRTQQGTQLFEYACHEGNRSMEAMLAGARANPKASRYWSAVGIAERAWLGHPAQARPSRAVLPSSSVALPRRKRVERGADD